MDMREWPVVRIFTRWFDSANKAIAGIQHAAKTQRHFKFHLAAAFVVLLFGFVIGVEKNEFALLAIVALLVISAETFNTAVENMVDLLSPERKELARIAKDVAAGAVLITSVGAIVVGYLILWPYFTRILSEGIHIHKHFSENIAVLAVIVNLLVIILLKSLSGTGLPLRGGFPSGHAAISFSLWVSVLHLTANRIVIGAALGIAMLASLSRLRLNIHSCREILFGAMTGSLITWVLFLIFKR